MLQKRSFNFLPCVPATGRPSPNEPRQPLVLGRRLRRWRNLPSGLLGPVNPRSLWLPASLWWDGPAATGRNATDHEVGIAREDRTGTTDDRTPPDTMLLDMTADDERVSGPVPRPRAGPAPGDKWIRLVVQGPAVFPRRRTPVLWPLPLMLIIIASLRVIAGPCHHRHQGRRPTASLRLVIIMREDERVLKGLVHHSLQTGSTAVPGGYPVTREENHNSDPFAGPVRSRGKTSNSDGSVRGCGRASRWWHGKWRPGRGRPGKWRPSRWWPSIWRVGRRRVSKTWWAICDRWTLPTQQASSQQRTAQHSTTRQVWPAQHAFSPWHWTAQQPIELQQGIRHRRDKTHPSWRVSAVLFSRQCQHLSTRLHWLILCPCGLCCSDGWTRVWLSPMPRPGWLQSTVPAPRDDTPPRTPVRWARTPVRRARGLDDTRESSRSRSPVTRSSSVDSPTRDASPVNFSTALDPEDKIKERSISDDEDEDGDHKISAAQYQLFRQAVTTSNRSFKVNPAKTRRASRASLLDLGDSEVTDRVLWLDQPSLKDTMASTARIAQGLKEDEEVEKTMLSETLNTASSTFKHLTVKQIFPREPYRLKVHRRAAETCGLHGLVRLESWRGQLNQAETDWTQRYVNLESCQVLR